TDEYHGVADEQVCVEAGDQRLHLRWDEGGIIVLQVRKSLPEFCFQRRTIAKDLFCFAKQGVDSRVGESLEHLVDENGVVGIIRPAEHLVANERPTGEESYQFFFCLDGSDGIFEPFIIKCDVRGGNVWSKNAFFFLRSTFPQKESEEDQRQFFHSGQN